MPVFKYKALQLEGKITEGQLEADGRQEAFRQMESKGLRPIRVVERGGATITTTRHSASSTSSIFAWAAAGLLALSLFLPAVNMDPWLRGFNLFVLSFYGTAFFGLASLVDGVKNGESVALVNFAICLVGASANVLVITTLAWILRGRRVPVQITALTLALTLAAGGALCHRSNRSMDETLAVGFFVWAGSAALLMAASIAQRPRRQSIKLRR
jgi:hypothetical protein